MNNPGKCPVCMNSDVVLWSTAKDYEYYSTNKEYFYYSCLSCEAIFIDPLPLDELDVIYPSNYYSFISGKKNWAFRVKEWLDRRLFTKVLKQIKGDTINVLDVGGGTGWLLDILKKSDPRINITQVVDIDRNARQIAESSGHLYFEGRIEDFTSDLQFHLVLMLNLVEHVSDPRNVLFKIQTMMAPGALILIKTPNTKSWDARLFRRSYWGGLHCPRHWIIFSKKSFHLLIQTVKLSVVSMKYTQGGPFWAFSIIISLSRKRLLKTNKDRPVIYHPLFPFISSLFAAFDFVRRPFAKTSQLFIILKND